MLSSFDQMLIDVYQIWLTKWLFNILIKIFSPDGRAGRDGTGRDGRRAGATGKHKKNHFFIEKSIFDQILIKFDRF